MTHIILALTTLGYIIWVDIMMNTIDTRKRIQNEVMDY